MNASLAIGLTALAIAGAWLPGRGRQALVLLAVLALTGSLLLSGALAAIAVPSLLALYASACWASRATGRWRVLAWAVFLLVAIGSVFRLLPGFASLTLSPAVPLKPGSQPYALTLNPGKALVAAALLLWLVPLARTPQDWRALRPALPVAVVTAIGVLLAGWALGHVSPAPGLPALGLSLGWAALNLLVVCTLEEGIFRGLLQRSLTRWLPAWARIGVAAALFGLAHGAGGAALVLLAMLAGVGYGLAYERAGQRLEAAILAHFALNALHFALFTYPAAD